jgi:hypothetical protein
MNLDRPQAKPGWPVRGDALHPRVADQPDENRLFSGEKARKEEKRNSCYLDTLAAKQLIPLRLIISLS